MVKDEIQPSPRPLVNGKDASNAKLTFFSAPSALCTSLTLSLSWPALAAEYVIRYGGISPMALPAPHSIDVSITLDNQVQILSLRIVYY